jgi:hypothetical protein
MWLVFSTATAAAAALALVPLFFISLGGSVDCGTDATMDDVRKGEFALIVGICLWLVPWVVGMAVSPRRVRFVVAAVFAVSPLLYGMHAGLDPEFWTHGFC